MTISINGTTGLITAGSSSSGGGGIATNTALGGDALVANTTGASNTAIGNEALKANTTASNNTAVGYQAAYSNVTGASITAVGYKALYASTGNNNTAIGKEAGLSTTTGTSNSFLGAFAGYANNTGANNVAIGLEALQANTTASDNTAVGYQALYTNATGTAVTALGYKAGYASTGSVSVYVGFNCGVAATGSSNTFIGSGAGEAVTSGAKNTIIGRYNGNQGGLDIRTSSNYIVLSDGDGNPRIINDGNVAGSPTSFGTTATILRTQSGGNGGVILNAGALGISDFARNISGVVAINLLSIDGTLITFRQDGTEEGSISVSGTTVSYNGGHLSRWSQLPDNSKDDTILKGTVLTNLDDMCVWVKDGETLPNEQLNKMQVSNVEGDVNVAGVFVNWTFDEECQSEDMNVAMTGDMIIRIADGVVVQKGDLLMSAGDGTAKPQGDDIRKSKTVAKVTSNHVTCTYADGSYCVPCVLMAC